MRPPDAAPRDAAPRDPAPGEEGPGAGDLDGVPRRIVLPAGLVGFPGLRRFEARRIDGGDLLELVSLDDRGFAVLGALLPRIAPDRLARLQGLGLAEPGQHVLVLLAAHGEPPVVTANLAGPIVVDRHGRGRQLVVEDPDFPLRAPLGSA